MQRRLAVVLLLLATPAMLGARGCDGCEEVTDEQALHEDLKSKVIVRAIGEDTVYVRVPLDELRENCPLVRTAAKREKAMVEALDEWLEKNRRRKISVSYSEAYSTADQRVMLESMLIITAPAKE